MNVIKDMLTGRSILIIGAALSLGSEMARQVATFKPTEFVTTRFGNVFGSKASVNTTFLLWQGSLRAERNIQNSTLRTAHNSTWYSRQLNIQHSSFNIQNCHRHTLPYCYFRSCCVFKSLCN